MWSHQVAVLQSRYSALRTIKIRSLCGCRVDIIFVIIICITTRPHRHGCSRIRGPASYDFCRDVGLMMLIRRNCTVCASDIGYSTAPDVFQLSGSLSGSACCNAAFIFRNQLLLRESIRRSPGDDRRLYIGSYAQIAKRVRLKASGVLWRIWQS